MYKYCTILVANNKGVDQTVQMSAQADLRLRWHLQVSHDVAHIFISTQSLLEESTLRLVSPVVGMLTWELRPMLEIVFGFDYIPSILLCRGVYTFVLSFCPFLCLFFPPVSWNLPQSFMLKVSQMCISLQPLIESFHIWNIVTLEGPLSCHD